MMSVTDFLKGESLSDQMAGAFSRIEKEDKDIHAFLSLSKEDALQAARASDTRREAGKALGPLDGVPVALKNNICVDGWATTAGSKSLESYIAPYDATVVKRLKAAGAILVGATNMDEFAMGSSTETSAFGVTKNPRDLSKVPGGSSGGSAAAVAAGFVPLALGSDTGGSVRQPASLCGVVGFKPSYGVVSRFGLIAMASSLDQIGPFANSVSEARMLFDVIRGVDPKDATTVVCEPSRRMTSMKGLRIGVPKEFFLAGMDEAVRASVESALARCEEQGAILVPLSLPSVDYALATYYVLMPCEVSSNLARIDGLRFGLRAKGDSLSEVYEHSREEGFGPEVKRRILLGTWALSKGYQDAYYKKALAVRDLIRSQMITAFSSVDVIASPTSPTVAWDLGAKFSDPLAMYLSDIYTISANLAGLPALSVPCGKAYNLPVGLQFMGAPFTDDLVLDVGELYESHSLPLTKGE